VGTLRAHKFAIVTSWFFNGRACAIAHWSFAASILQTVNERSPSVGGTFPSVDAKQEWKQVLTPHEEDYEDNNLVGATGWVLNPTVSEEDFPFDHPFAFDWEFQMALDQPAVDPKRFTFLLTRGNQSCEDPDMIPALKQAIGLKMMPDPTNPNDQTKNLVPHGSDDQPSVLGVEIDSGLVPKQFLNRWDGGVVKGDRIAVFGRWIVDCGHQRKLLTFTGGNVDPSVQAFRAEIHPPLLMAVAKVVDDSILGLGTADKVTRVLFTSRPYLVSQRFVPGSDVDTIYNDNATNDGPFFDHLKTELEHVALGSQLIEAHPKIKSFPFRGANVAQFIIRPPPETQTGHGDRLKFLQVAFRFTIRSGCTVQVTSDGSSINVFITLNHINYTPPPLPSRGEHTWSEDELSALNERAKAAYADIDKWATRIAPFIGGLELLEIKESSTKALRQTNTTLRECLLQTF
jgi:hypothetical protein